MTLDRAELDRDRRRRRLPCRPDRGAVDGPRLGQHARPSRRRWKSSWSTRSACIRRAPAPHPAPPSQAPEIGEAEPTPPSHAVAPAAGTEHRARQADTAASETGQARAARVPDRRRLPQRHRGFGTALANQARRRYFQCPRQGQHRRAFPAPGPALRRPADQSRRGRQPHPRHRQPAPAPQRPLAGTPQIVRVTASTTTTIASRSGSRTLPSPFIANARRSAASRPSSTRPPRAAGRTST